MSTALVKSEIERFLGSSKPEVLAVRGKWGVGKTFAWSTFLGQAKAEQRIGLKRYAYVSLFGIGSLDALRYAIFENTVVENSIGSAASFETLSATIEGLGRKHSGILKALASVIPLPGMKDAVGQIFPYFLGIKDQIVCIDDLERRGSGLAVEDVLGLISFLKEQRNCKVVLLLNDEALDGDDRDAFDKHLEKVVDASLRFAPTPREAAEIAVTGDDSVCIAIRAACITLEISNIRVIRRIEGLVRSAQEQLTKYEPAIATQAIQSVIILAWCVFAPNDSPSLDYILSRRLGRYGEPRLEEGTGGDTAWAAKLQEYGFTHADELDLALLEGVKNGFFDPAALAGSAKALDDRVKAQGADDSFSDAWSLFHDTFANNTEEVVKTIHASFLANMAFISPLNLNGTVRLLKDLGEPDLAGDIIAKYVAQTGKPRSFFDLADYAFAGDIDDDDVHAAFAEKLRSYQDTRDPVASLLRLSDGWQDDDLDYLASLDSSIYVEIFKQHEGKELRKLLSNALKFDRVGNATASMRRITALAKEALGAIGGESVINARRVRKYGVIVEPEGGSDGAERVEPEVGEQEVERRPTKVRPPPRRREG
jgi:hypothetical protein